MLGQPFLALINRTLARQAWARARLGEHIGQIAALQCGAIDWRLGVTDEVSFVEVGAEPEPAVRLILSPSALLDWLSGKTGDLSHSVEISGNARFAETLSLLLQHLRPDVGAELSPLLGDVLAQRAEQMLWAVGRQSSELMHRGKDALRESLAAENVDFVLRRAAQSAWQAEIQTLAERVAMLETRVQRI